MFYIRHLLLFTILILFSSLIGCAGYSNAVHIHETNIGYELHVPVSKLAVTIPKNGFIQKDNRIGGSTDNPRYFYFVNESNNIIISGWFEPEEEFSNINKFWEEEIKAYNQKGLPNPIDVKFERIRNWDAIIYDTSNPNYTNSHIRAHWLQAGTWIDLHISITNSSNSSTNRSKLKNLLKKIVVKEY